MLLQTMRGNAGRCPQDFVFSLTDHQVGILRSQIGTSKPADGRCVWPYAHSEFMECMETLGLGDNALADLAHAMNCYYHYTSLMPASALSRLSIMAIVAWSIGTPLHAGEPAKDAGTELAMLVVESPELAGMRSIPIINSRTIKFRISSFAGCPADATQAPAMTELSHGTLSPKKNSEAEVVPGNADLAVFAEFTNASGGNSFSCERGLRFHSEAGKTYHLRYVPPQQHFMHPVPCDMSIVETRDGNELPVPSAHHAILDNKGFWKGSDWSLCASGAREDQPAVN